MAPTCPSIIPLGAQMSAPASAWATATSRVQLDRGVVVDLAAGRRARRSGRGRCTRRGRGRPSARCGRRRRRAGRAGPAARCRRDPTPRSPRASLWRHAEQDRRRARRGRPARRPPCAATRGCAGRRRAATAIGWGSSMPSRTNSGAIRSSTDRRVSATRRRSAGVRRNRRRRRSGKVTPPAYEEPRTWSTRAATSPAVVCSAASTSTVNPRRPGRRRGDRSDRGDQPRDGVGPEGGDEVLDRGRRGEA